MFAYSLKIRLLKLSRISHFKKCIILLNRKHICSPFPHATTFAVPLQFISSVAQIRGNGRTQTKRGRRKWKNTKRGRVRQIEIKGAKEGNLKQKLIFVYLNVNIFVIFP